MKQFFATAKMRVKESSTFGAVNLLGGYLLRVAGTLAMLMIWRQLADANGDLGGMTLEQLITFTLLTTMLHPMLDVRTPISSWLHEGVLIGLYQRPMGVLSQLTAMTLGGWCTHLALLSLPLLLFTPLLGGFLTPRSGWFFPSLALAVVQGFCVDFLFGCLIVRASNMSWQIECLRGALTGLLTGAVIPFALLPGRLGELLSLSPLGTLAGASLSLFVGTGDPATLIPAQLLWTALLLPLSLYCFQRSTEGMMSYGG